MWWQLCTCSKITVVIWLGYCTLSDDGYGGIAQSVRNIAFSTRLHVCLMVCIILTEVKVYATSTSFTSPAHVFSVVITLLRDITVSGTTVPEKREELEDWVKCVTVHVQNHSCLQQYL